LGKSSLEKPQRYRLLRHRRHLRSNALCIAGCALAFDCDGLRILRSLRSLRSLFPTIRQAKVGWQCAAHATASRDDPPTQGALVWAVPEF
jgi:hypothetical protein